MMNQSLSQQQGHVNSELIVLRAISQPIRREPRPNTNTHRWSNINKIDKSGLTKSNIR